MSITQENNQAEKGLAKKSQTFMKLRNKSLVVLVLALILAVIGGVFSAYLPSVIALGIIGFLIIAVIIWRSPMTGILITALFLPLERIGAWEYLGMTIRLSQIFLIITSLVWFLKGLIQQRLTIAKNPLILPGIIFVGINFLSVLNSLNSQRSLIILGFTVFTMLLAFLIPNLVRRESDLRKVVGSILISAFLVSIFGIYQFIGDSIGLAPEITGLRDLYTKEVLGFPRIQSTAYEPLYFANYLLIPLGIIIALFLIKEKKIPYTISIPLIILFATNLFLTISRGGYLGCFVLLAVLGVIYLKNLLTPKKITGFMVIAIIVGYLGLRFLGVEGAVNLEKYTEHVRNVFYGASFEERIETFDQAQQAYAEHPFLGIGMGSFGPYTATHPYLKPAGGWKIVNNEFIEVLAETGILGLAAFIGLLAILFFRSVKALLVTKDKYLKAILAGLLAAFVGVLVQYQTFSTLYIMHVWFLFGLMIAVQNMILLPELDDKKLEKNPPPASLRPPDTLTRVMRAGEALRAGKFQK